MKLLVVEDDRLLNNTLCYNLSTAGYTVDAAMTKSEAVNFCEAQDYDLIVLDVNLPDGSRRLCDKAVPYQRIPKKGFRLAGPHPEADRRRLLHRRHTIHQFFGNDCHPRRGAGYLHAVGIPFTKGAG